MGKAKRAKAERKGNTRHKERIMDFPINLTRADEKHIQALMAGTIEALPPGLDFMPCPIDIFFLHEEGTGRWMSLFSLGSPDNRSQADMRGETIMTKELMQEIVDKGQEPLWEWLRNISVLTCVNALAKGLEMPDRIGVQLAGALRAHDIDQDKEFQDQMHKAAQAQAMAAMMGQGLSE